ncbi:MAG: hypothetical protein AAFX78_03500 [Cyanobacteria bacterium J06638_20]
MSQVTIYHPEHGQRIIPAIDFTQAWRSRGWDDAPKMATAPEGQPSEPALVPHPPPEPTLFDAATARTAELEALLASEGWDEIKKIAESFDPPVPKGETWGKTIPAIVEREQVGSKT